MMRHLTAAANPSVVSLFWMPFFGLTLWSGASGQAIQASQLNAQRQTWTQAITHDETYLRQLVYVTRQRLKSCIAKFGFHRNKLQAVVRLLFACRFVSSEEAKTLNGISSPIDESDDPTAALDDARLHPKFWQYFFGNDAPGCEQIRLLSKFVLLKNTSLSSFPLCTEQHRQIVREQMLDVCELHRVVSLAHHHFGIVQLQKLSHELRQNEQTYHRFVQIFLFGLLEYHSVQASKLTAQAVRSYLAPLGLTEPETDRPQRYKNIWPFHSAPQERDPFYPHIFEQILANVLQHNISIDMVHMSEPIRVWQEIAHYNRLLGPVFRLFEVNSKQDKCAQPPLYTSFELVIQPIAQHFTTRSAAINSFFDRDHELQVYFELFERRIRFLTIGELLCGKERHLWQPLDLVPPESGKKVINGSAYLVTHTFQQLLIHFSFIIFWHMTLRLVGVAFPRAVTPYREPLSMSGTDHSDSDYMLQQESTLILIALFVLLFLLTLFAIFNRRLLNKYQAIG